MIQIKLARAIAIAAHIGQKYGDGPYIRHPEGVAEIVSRMCDSTADEVAAAWLHDVIEDTRLTTQDLLFAGVNLSIVELVERLTRRWTEDYFDYIRRVSRCGRASRVKMADLEFNLAYNPNPRAASRYRWAQTLLQAL